MSHSWKVPTRAAEVWSYVTTMFGHAKSHQSPPQRDLGSLNSTMQRLYFQTVAISSSHQCANDFLVHDSSVSADPYLFFF